MNDIARAQAAKNLGNDPVFQEVMESVRQEQADVFLSPSSTGEAIEDAHNIIRALDKIEARIRAAKNTLSVASHKADRGQHRYGD